MSPQHAASGRANLLLFALNSSLDLLDQASATILDVFGSLQCTQQLILEHMHWGGPGEARQASAGVSSTVRRAGGGKAGISRCQQHSEAGQVHLGKERHRSALECRSQHSEGSQATA